MSEPGTKEKYEARMKPGRKKGVKDEFEEWVEDMSYGALKGSPSMRAYIFEAFVGGWGAKARQIKRRRKSREQS